jgi:hypothetical protein
MAHYDDDPDGALTTALRRVLGRTDGSLAELPTAAGFEVSVKDDVSARDRLVRDLNELRDLPR